MTGHIRHTCRMPYSGLAPRRGAGPSAKRHGGRSSRHLFRRADA